MDSAERLRGLAEGLGDAQVSFVSAGTNSVACAVASTRLALRERPSATAVVAVSDLMALAVVDELRNAGLDVPRDVSVAGFDGIDAALAAELTTIGQPIVEKGRRAAQLLLDPDARERQVFLPSAPDGGPYDGSGTASVITCLDRHMPDTAYSRAMENTLWTALGDPHRRAVLDLLAQGELSVGDLVERLGLTQPQTSKHLRVLRDAGLVRVEQRAQRRIYAVDPGPMTELDALARAVPPAVEHQPRPTRGPSGKTVRTRRSDADD